jgi:phage tail-like protein
VSRRDLPGLPTPHPLGAMLPAVYLEDSFAQRFTAGLDEVLAPVLLTLDNLAAYVDPRFAPEDFLAWLSRWVGAEPDETWPEERRRSVVAAAVVAHRRRGTLSGLVEHVRLVADVDVEVTENGGAAWGAEPGTAAPGTAGPPHVTVRVTAADPARVDRTRLDRAVRESLPAHVTLDVEVATA